MGGEWTLFSPLKNFKEIIRQDGYPVISKQISQKINHIRKTKKPGKYIRACFGLDGKDWSTIPLIYIHFLDKNFIDYDISHKCCNYIKGGVKHDKRPTFISTTIEESRLRKNSWIKNGCIVFSNNQYSCRPISLWKEEDVWKYIRKYNLKISNIYEKGFKRSGCTICMFGMSLESAISKKNKEFLNRFELLYKFNENLFNEFVLSDDIKLWKPLTDSWIHLKNVENKKYQKLYKQRKKQLINWYQDFEKNFNKVLDEIENRCKNQKLWTKEERGQIFNKYKKSKVLVERILKNEQF